ncbi:HEPN domain protein [Neomoorella glycerini]|uniref:HEPN domain protein n=1 Tax=Neomoorella glycerini TaxID=55779 RepID=A0A6I5ZQ39_9FIRM|nr:HEPN domain-containing protein [Moorella glycerini]QGP91651.1 HEPN domain protein [Moorella glycerini]
MKEDNHKRTLIKYRLNEAYEVLADAQKLLASQGSPRSIVNRSYYAMFYATLALLVTIDQGSAKHSGVISLFDRYFVKPGIFQKELSKSLHRAFEFRQQGDYGEVTPIVVEDAIELLQAAEKFIHTVQRYLNERGFAD